MEYTIKPMQKENLDEVIQIEEESFGQHSWSKNAFFEELNSSLANYFCVFNNKNEMVAYAGFWHIIDEAHITTIAVKTPFRRQKIGEFIVNYIVEQCYKKEIKYITLEVRKSNAAAINLYEKFGFKSLGVRKNYYQDTNEDALIMWTENIFWDNFKNSYVKVKEELKELL